VLYNESVIDGRMSAVPDLDRLFAALSDPTRRALLARLAQGEATVGDLAAPLPMSQPAVSRHLAVLEAAGLVVQLRRGASRPRRLRGEGLRLASDWLDAYRLFWDDRFARLDTLLADMGNQEREEQADD